MLKAVKRPGTPFYIARGTINGKRIERSTGCRKKADADQRCREIEAEETRNQAVAGSLRFDQAVAIYLTANPDARYIAPALRHFRNTPVAEINNAAMRAAANAIYPSAAPATIRRQLYTPVKAILNLCAEDDLCAVPKLKAPAGGNSRTVFFMPDQADKIISFLAGDSNPHYAPMVTTLIGQGIRIGEAVALEWPDVSLDARIAILRDTKNGEERRITLIDRVVAALSTIRPERAVGPVFKRLDGTAFPASDPAKNGGGQIRSPFERAVIAAGLDPRRFTPHVCRHTWATWYYAQTKDPLRMKEEGGWKSDQWLRYTKLATPELGALAAAHGWHFLPRMGEYRGTQANVA